MGLLIDKRFYIGLKQRDHDCKVNSVCFFTAMINTIYILQYMLYKIEDVKVRQYFGFCNWASLHDINLSFHISYAYIHALTSGLSFSCNFRLSYMLCLYACHVRDLYLIALFLNQQTFYIYRIFFLMFAGGICYSTFTAITYFIKRLTFLETIFLIVRK